MTLLEVIADEDMSVLEKVNFIRKLNLIDYAKSVNFDNFITLLKNFEKVDNFEIEGWLEKIISHVNIKSYFHKILLYLE